MSIHHLLTTLCLVFLVPLAAVAQRLRQDVRCQTEHQDAQVFNPHACAMSMIDSAAWTNDTTSVALRMNNDMGVLNSSRPRLMK